MSTYTHLTQEERDHIETMRKQKISLNTIAKGMGRARSTLSRELKRNSGQRGYRYQQADKKAKQRHHDKPKAIKLDQAMQPLITPLIKEKWSPEQVSGRLKQEGKQSVSHETIYRFLLIDKAAGGELYTHLRHQAKRYRKRYGKKDYRGIIPARVDIDERPAIVDDKSRLGDWEADTVIGKGHQGVLVTLTERVSKLNLVIPIVRKEAELTKEAIIQALTPFATWVPLPLVTVVSFASTLKSRMHWIARPISPNLITCGSGDSMKITTRIQVISATLGKESKLGFNY